MPTCYHDVTLTINTGTPVYPGDPPVEITQIKNIAADGYNLSLLKFGSHTGTHIDPPRHFFTNGASIDEIPMDYLVGQARVLVIPDKKEITKEDLLSFAISPGERILLKTRNSSLLYKNTFIADYTYLTSEAAVYLAQIPILILGFDYLSIEKYACASPEAHLALLGKGIPLIEGLNLADVSAGEYEMSALPLKIENGDGAPARVVLFKITVDSDS